MGCGLKLRSSVFLAGKVANQFMLNAVKSTVREKDNDRTGRAKLLPQRFQQCLIFEKGLRLDSELIEVCRHALCIEAVRPRDALGTMNRPKINCVRTC